MAEEPQVKNIEQDAQREARRQLALSQIRHYPDPVLRMRAHEVERFDSDLARLAQRMTELMHDALGVGLAANQVGILQRICIIQASEEDEARIAVNPRLTPIGEETEVDEEGCLSVQGVQVPVERALAVRLEARGLNGEKLDLELEGLAARAAQHELDHLDGVLIIDRTTPEARRQALATLRPRVVVSAGG
jgi:peptide deformylase